MDALPRYRAPDLVSFARTLLVANGLATPMADAVATVLVDGDLLGHTTHGLQLLAPYLREIQSGSMRSAGEPDVVSRRTASEHWDGRRLPGPWVVLRAIDAAMRLARDHGTGTISIRRSHHIACLAAYLERATDNGLLMLLACSDPAVAHVAPFGGLTPVFTPNPLAVGIPTSGDPILIDISASLTTVGMTSRLYQERRTLPHPWLQDHQGNATNDPAVLFNDPKGTLLPTGGLDAGHKGFAMALLIEALTGGVAGHGRADPADGWGATVFVQIIDPGAFGGIGAFTRQTDWLVDACRSSTPRPGGDPVRLPGERALARRRNQQQRGVALYAGILDALRPWAERFGVPLPTALDDDPM